MQYKFEVEGGNFSKAGTASSEVKKILNQLNVDYKLIKRIVVALYEAEVNIVAHADKGIIDVDIEALPIQSIRRPHGFIIFATPTSKRFIYIVIRDSEDHRVSIALCSILLLKNLDLTIFFGVP